MARKQLLYRDIDPRGVPNYTVAEACFILGVPAPTIRSWVIGRKYLTTTGQRDWRPIVDLAQKSSPLLSFTNLVEVHVLDSIRRNYPRITVPKIRVAVRYIEKQLGIKHPLANADLLTDRLDLFTKALEKIINTSRDGQLAIPSVVSAYLQRIERDENGLAERLFPYGPHLVQQEQPRVVVVDPWISFGRPVLNGTGVPIDILLERIRTGDRIDEVAKDYNRSEEEINQAVAWAERTQKAA